MAFESHKIVHCMDTLKGKNSEKNVNILNFLKSIGIPTKQKKPLE